MRVLRIVPLFLLLLLGTPAFVPQEANAWTCCDCTVCHWKLGCVCPGTPGYCPGYACNRDESELFKVVVREMETVYLTKLNDCSRRNLAMSLLGDAKEPLKIQPFALGEGRSPIRVTALQTQP